MNGVKNRQNDENMGDFFIQKRMPRYEASFNKMRQVFESWFCLSGIFGMLLQDILAVVTWFYTRKLLKSNIKGLPVFKS
jgi:hypothetical protein